MTEYDAYDLAIKIINRVLMPNGRQLLTADNEYLCKELETVIEAYNILKKRT